MIYDDAVYGLVEINEPILLALLETAALQRLKGVLQHGITGLIGITDKTTRFDHSVGAMLLVRRLGASVEEEIAALLHDASHTAFSHVIDYVFDGHDSQSYHDEKKEEFVAETDIPATLAQFGYDWRDFLHEENFPLLEQPSPRLCADRLDYFLRDAGSLGLATPAEIDFAIASLVVVEASAERRPEVASRSGRIATANLQTAQWLGYTFIAADDASWANFDEVGLYELTARAIKTGFRVGAVSLADIWGTDEPMWAKLHAHPDRELQAQLALITPETRFAWDEQNPTFWVSTKLRAIDPDVVVGGELRPLSTFDPDFAQHRQDYLTRKAGKWPMRVVPG
ncbi:MAG: HD domain-containing protein [Chloroflexi bacterium]|nr:HD domain-containing protein [Chloroflexota bacterium]